MIRPSILLLALVAFFYQQSLFANEPVSLDELLNQVKTGRAEDAETNAERIKAFEANLARQGELLEQAQAEQTFEEKRSETLETRFEENEAEIARLEEVLNDRLGSLKELFGVIQQVAGDTRGQFENSLTQVQFPERTQFLNELAQKMGETSELASIDDIERLWFELQREMTESGKVVQFPAEVVSTDGDQAQRDVTRVGLFNVIADGKYLDYLPETGRLVELARQPQQRYLASATELENANEGPVAFGLDPSRGQLLSLLVQTPGFQERINQGGIIGYIILGLGALALLIALQRLLVLTITSIQVNRQIHNPNKPDNNALGRVLKTYYANTQADIETLELKLEETILKETPKFNRLTMLLKIISVVAPLLGLLGTVTGMIITFQAISLFGTGDPKLMANGISQALVTTALGLMVAIPTVLLHTLVAGRGKRLTQILEEQAAGLVAEHAEKHNLALSDQAAEAA
jgi:biopolymer transport protein ExbB